MESRRASFIELQDEMNTEQIEHIRPSLRPFLHETGGMVSGKSLGGILVADDDPDIRKFIRIILEDSGYNVLEAEDGEEAINVLTGGENSMVVDTVITDLSMPKIDGFEAIGYFQKEFPDIPLIVLTGIADLELAASFMRRGVSAYLVKPVGVDQLKAAVARALAERQLSWA